MAAVNDFVLNAPSLAGPCRDIEDVGAGNDTADLAHVSRGLVVSTAGDVSVNLVGGSSGLLPSLVAGITHPYMCTKVFATNTTATGIKAVR